MILWNDTRRVAAKSLAVWFGILVFAMVNGAIREKLLIPTFGPFAGQVVSGIALSGFIFLAAVIAVRWVGRLRELHYWMVGLYWLALTLVFEFGFGHWVQHKDWSELLDAYTFQGGNIWPLVLITTLVAPWAAASVIGSRLPPAGRTTPQQDR